jgi:hypothetical protein
MGVRHDAKNTRRGRSPSPWLAITARAIRVLMSGERRREQVTSRSEQTPRGLALGDGIASEPPVSPIPVSLALRRSASGRAAMHPATALPRDLGRRAGSGPSAALAAHGVVPHFLLPPGWFTAPTMAWPPSLTFTC